MTTRLPESRRQTGDAVPRRHRDHGWALVLLLAALSGCQSTSGLPSVDDAQRRPINSATAIELQTCKAQASALRATLTETQAPQCPKADVLVTLAQPEAASVQPTAPAPASRVAVFLFEQGQVALTVDSATRAALKAAAQGAEQIQVRGRSGAQLETPADVLAARRRAEAAASLLKELGVPGHKLKVSWQGMADEGATTGQGRRVEIEFVDKAAAVLFTKAASDKSGSPEADGNPMTPAQTRAANGTAATRSPASKS